MTEEKHPRYFVYSLEKGLAVLGAFAKQGTHLTLSEIAQAIDMVPPTASRYVRTLEDLGYLVRDPKTRSYSLSVKILSIGFGFIENLDIRHRVSSHLLEMTKQLNVNTACTILDQTEVVYIERFRSNSLVTLNLTVGSRLPAYCTAQGRAILAFLDPREAKQIIEASDIKAHTPYTITDRKLLLKKLAEVREKGLAFNQQELVMGQAAIAAPIMKGQEVEGSFGASFPVEFLERKGFLEGIQNKIRGISEQVNL
ncbi:MAG: IclR family transcriptional regulator [Thermodesulfobacteriota bacterium]